MAFGGEDDSKKYFRDRKMNVIKVNMKYDRLSVFIRHDSAEIWRVRYRLIIVIGTLKIMARTGVFVLVVCALKHPIKYFPSQKKKHSFDLNEA
jgi:hypothetical protein